MPPLKGAQLPVKPLVFEGFGPPINQRIAQAPAQHCDG
jgi:hypothetical protein